MRTIPLSALAICTLLTACGGDGGSSSQEQTPALVSGPQRPPLPADRVYNAEAVIPPQCYTRTEGRFNPCYTCHQTYDDANRPNYMADGVLQGDYAFSEVGVTDHWRNLFVDRRDAVAAIADRAVREYIHVDNYAPFVQRLRNDPDWTGPVPAIDGLAEGAAAFDEHGMARDGSGWVAFNYKPLPSTFWATNGNTDDVMIRLPTAFRRSDCTAGAPRPSRAVYLANLGILEAAVKGTDRMGIPAVDENVVCADLNRDGRFTRVTEVVRGDFYVGAADDVPVQTMRYPVGTQFLHTVRYVAVGPEGDTGPSRRMKEVRYMKKIRTFDNAELRSLYGNEQQEKREGNLPSFVDRGDHGIDNGMGWMVLGFIEGADGELRKQSHEEELFCMGCHTTIGTTVDQTFAFPRKVDGAKGWGYIDLHGMPDAPSLGSDEGEILRYLRRVGGGNEFRENPEMQARWFHDDGSVREDAVRSADVHELTSPSAERALELDKAYWITVMEQSFIYGRDATLAPAENVYREVDPAKTVPLQPEHRVKDYDIRLRWEEDD